MSRPKGLPLTFHSLGQLWALMSLSRTGLVPAGAPCHGWLEEWLDASEESVISKCSRLVSSSVANVTARLHFLGAIVVGMNRRLRKIVSEQLGKERVPQP